MNMLRPAGALLVMLLAFPSFGNAQVRPQVPDSFRAQIHTTLRAFYFNLAHQAWEALTADILAAKVVAHRPAPEAILSAAARSSWAPDPRECDSRSGALVDRASIMLEGDWAEVAVPRCTLASVGTDEFRLIHFEERWRIVYIELFQQPVNVSAER